MLVVGSTGHGLLGRITPGGTVQRLLPTATAPWRSRRAATGTRQARASCRSPSPTTARPRLIGPSVAAVHLASRTGAVLRFVTVAPTPGGRARGSGDGAQRPRRTAPLDIDALADVVVGPVARMLADLPERTDLLVIGSRGYRFMRRLLLGGVAGAFVRSARYPVVIVPSLG